jgi:2-methylcitrate dehydratase
LNTRIVIKTKDGRIFDCEQLGYEGGLGDPLSWERVVEKFNWLSEPFADAALRHNIVEAVVKIDERPVADLMGLLGKVNPKAVYPAFHPGIQ